MVKRWLIYLAVWSGCLIFYYAYQEWIAWILLASVTLLPVFSLLVSLPVMLTTRLQVTVPESVALGAQQPVGVSIRSVFPLPRWRVQILAHHSLTNRNYRLHVEGDYPTECCGALECSLRRGRIYDYLGLFCLPMRSPGPWRLLVRPQALQPVHVPDLEQQMAAAWQPKPGGGFSENHELRLYRPGDNLRQIHWKLSSKTGELIFREAMEPRGSHFLLWLHLDGDEQQLNHKLGRLLWMGGYLQRRDLVFDILACTGDGIRRWHVGHGSTLRQAMDALLCQAPLRDSQPEDPELSGLWQYYIGGDDDETP